MQIRGEETECRLDAREKHIRINVHIRIFRIIGCGLYAVLCIVIEAMCPVVASEIVRIAAGKLERQCRVDRWLTVPVAFALSAPEPREPLAKHSVRA